MALEPLISSLNFFFKVTLSNLQFFFIRKFNLSQRFLAVCQETKKKCFPSFGSLRLVLTSLRRAGGVFCFCVSLWAAQLPPPWQLHPQLLGSIPLPHQPSPPAVLQLLGSSRHFPRNASEFKFLGPAPVVLASFATFQHLTGSPECCSPIPLHSRRNHKTLPDPNKYPQKHHPTTSSPC